MDRVVTRVLRPPHDPVHGTLHVPEGDAVAGALLIGGSGGSEPTYIAEPLARSGIAALSVAYFARPGLPDELSEIPLEYFCAALAILRAGLPAQTPVATVGLSRGSEAAVLAAVDCQERVDGAVLSVPGNVVLAGYPSGGPAWLLDGKPLAWTEGYGPSTGDPRTFLPVEQVQGPMLLVAAGADELWPSAPMARAICERLESHGHPFGCELLEYPRARHALGYLVPQLPPGLLPPDLADDPASQAAREDAWPKVVAFLVALGSSVPSGQ
jgi:dienelactone hydrolase